jgi:hypothetical protein
MTVTLPDLPSEQRTPGVEALFDRGRQRRDRVQEREATNQQLRDACALLKGPTPRPPRNPSILQRPAPTTAPTPTERRCGTPTRPRTREPTIHREVPLHPPTLPAGAVGQGLNPTWSRTASATTTLPAPGGPATHCPGVVRCGQRCPPACSRSRAGPLAPTWWPTSGTGSIRPRSPRRCSWRHGGRTAAPSRPVPGPPA